MSDAAPDKPRYPIGQFAYGGLQTAEQRRGCIERIAAAPALVRRAVAGLTETQLDTPYREGGWTARQVVHHLPDSHLNAYTRFRLALTEPTPTIRPYFEHLWAELPDARTAPIELSLTLLEALHRRWVLLLRRPRPGRVGGSLPAPRARARVDSRRGARDVCLARRAPHRTHRHASHAQGLELTFSRTGALR